MGGVPPRTSREPEMLAAMASLATHVPPTRHGPRVGLQQRRPNFSARRRPVALAEPAAQWAITLPPPNPPPYEFAAPAVVAAPTTPTWPWWAWLGIGAGLWWLLSD
jgi:hypothetical protein